MFDVESNQLPSRAQPKNFQFVLNISKQNAKNIIFFSQ